MTSFLFEIGARRRKTARLIGQVRDEIVRAFVHEKITHKISQDDLAAKLEVDKSVVSKDLNKLVNMTLSKIADYAWALDYEISIKFFKKSSQISEIVYENKSAIANYAYSESEVGELEEA